MYDDILSLLTIFIYTAFDLKNFEDKTIYNLYR